MQYIHGHHCHSSPLAEMRIPCRAAAHAHFLVVNKDGGHFYLNFKILWKSYLQYWLLQYLMNFNILCSNQYGFSKNHSTALTLINLPDKISTVFDRGEFFVGIFLDLSKAFNTVNHVILLINSNIRVFMAYSTGHRHCSITYVFHVWKSAILHANSTGKTLVKHSCKNIHAKIQEKIHAN